MLSKYLFRSCLVAIMVAMVHAGGSKSSKNGKGGGRWSGGGRWTDSHDSWSSPDWRGQDDHDDNWWGQDRDDIWWGSGKGGHDDKWWGSGKGWGWYCTLANPVQEQYDLIIKTWKIAYLANNANAAAIATYEEETISHANMMMNKFMKIVEDYEGGDFDKDAVKAMGETEGKTHPSSVKFTTDDQKDAICALTKALVLMMKESCYYDKWKETFEICAYYYMSGFIDGAKIDMKLNQCIDFADDKDK